MGGPSGYIAELREGMATLNSIDEKVYIKEDVQVIFDTICKTQTQNNKKCW